MAQQLKAMGASWPRYSPEYSLRSVIVNSMKPENTNVKAAFTPGNLKTGVENESVTPGRTLADEIPARESIVELQRPVLRNSLQRGDLSPSSAQFAKTTEETCTQLTDPASPQFAANTPVQEHSTQ